MATRLLSLDVAMLNAFLRDVYEPSSSCAPHVRSVDNIASNISRIGKDELEAWIIYAQAERTCLKTDINRLIDLAKAHTDNNLKNQPFGFTTSTYVDIAKALGTAGSYTEHLDKTLFKELIGFGKIKANFDNIDKLKAKLSQANSGAAIEGTAFIVEYMGANPQEFNGGNYEFEVYENTWARYVDVQDNRKSAEPVLYEFKSVQESSFNATDFTLQFVKDLSNPNVTKLSQIRWIFDHNKMNRETVKTKVLEALSRNLPILNNAKDEGIQKFTAWFGLLNPDDDITVKNVEYFIDANFSVIFK